MKLVRIAKKEWDVLALCDNRGRCQVLDFLAELDGPYQVAAESMLALLHLIVPAAGPPRGEPLTKHLGEGIFEFRRQPKGKKLRVVWFYGGGAIIVCTAAFRKAERTPRSQIEQARFLSRQYWLARVRNELEIVDLKREGP